MKNVAPNVFRWTERMNTPAIADGEFPGHAEGYLPNDEIPPSLERVLQLMFQDWGPELLANAQLYDTWLDRNPGLPAGHRVSASGEHRVHPTLGFIDFEWRGCAIHRASSPHSLWHFERAASCVRSLEGDARARFRALAERTVGQQVLAIRLGRPLRRENYALVLG
jgi:hypothetical protein